MEHKEKFTKASKGPRMDGKPGNMYERLGNSDEERQKNLALIKAWVGEDAWLMKRKGDITKVELLKIKAKY